VAFSCEKASSKRSRGNTFWPNWQLRETGGN
jgi:hypothetical protein